MNELILQLPLKPLSVNSKFTLNKYSRRIIKSVSANKFEKAVNGMLSQYGEAMKRFRESFDKKTQGLMLEVVMYVPEDEFFTQKGEISSTCIDAGNALKMLEDIIFKALELNDGLNVKVSSEKRPYIEKEWLTLVTISKVIKPKSCYLDNVLVSKLNGPERTGVLQ